MSRIVHAAGSSGATVFCGAVVAGAVVAGTVTARPLFAGPGPFPPPPLDKIADIVEMQRQIGMAGANRLRVRLPLPLVAPHHLFAEQVLGDLQVHLDVEPSSEAPDLGAVERS